MFKNVLFLILLLLANPSLWSTSPTVLWSFDLKAPSFGNACSADLDDDGKLEIVFSTYTNDGYIYVLNSEDGSVLWKYNTNGCNDAAPLIIDVDRDGQLDIILRTSCSNMMYCFNG